MRLKSKLLTTAGAILVVSSMGIASVGAAAPPPVNVTNEKLTCDTVVGSIKFPTALTISGTPGTTTNQPDVAVGLDGCTDISGTCPGAGCNPAGIIISATKFKLHINTAAWVNGTGSPAGNGCEADGSVSSPPGSGTHQCHAEWDFGGKPDHAQHNTDINGNFGANGFTSLAGTSSATPSTTTIAWKCAGPAKAKCYDNFGTIANAGHTSTVATIADNYGTTANDPFGIGRGAFFVGSPLNGQTIAGTTIPPGSLSAECTRGGAGCTGADSAFSGSDHGAGSTFEGMLQQSASDIEGYLLGKGIKTLTFGVGTITSK